MYPNNEIILEEESSMMRKDQYEKKNLLEKNHGFLFSYNFFVAIKVTWFSQFEYDKGVFLEDKNLMMRIDLYEKKNNFEKISFN